MAQAVSTFITRRGVAAGLALIAAPGAVLATAKSAHAQAKQTMPEKTLYERLGGVFSPSQFCEFRLIDRTHKKPRGFLCVWLCHDSQQLAVWRYRDVG